MNWHAIWVAALFLIVGAWIGSKWPATNVIGRLTG